MNTGDVYVVAVLSEEATQGGRVMAVPRNCVFGENIAHYTFIVVFEVRGAVIAGIVSPRRVTVSVVIAIAIVTIPVSAAGIVGRIRILRIFVGSVWVVAPVPAPPRTPPWKAEVADKDDFIEIVEVMKSMIWMKVAVVEASEPQG